MTHSFSNSQWLEMLERDWMFNKAAFDLLESHRQASTCPELKVAAAIYGYRNATIDLLSIGINGSPLDRSDPPLHIHKRSCIHAEDRALRQLPAKSRHYHLVCYTSLAPCLGCAEKLYNAGIEAVSYIREYSEKAGKEFLLNKGKPVYKLKATGKMVPLNPVSLFAALPTLCKDKPHGGLYMKCPVCNDVLRHRRDGAFECPSCQFVGDHARVLKVLRLHQEGERLLRRSDGERELLMDGLRALQIQGNSLPLEKAIEAIHSCSPQSTVPVMEMRHFSRKKYALMLASIEVGAFADWFISSLGSLLEGKVPILQAAFPFMFLFQGAVLLYVTAK